MATVSNAINDKTTGLNIVDDTDTTKQLSFNVSGITTAMTRTWTIDDRNINFGAVPTSIITDSGTSTPSSGSFSLVGSGLATSASGSVITITFQGAFMTREEVTTNSKQMAVNYDYTVTYVGGGNVEFTLPSSASVGDLIYVTTSSTPIIINQNSGQVIHNQGIESTNSGAGGSLESDGGQEKLHIQLKCIAEDTDFAVIQSIGAWTYN